MTIPHFLKHAPPHQKYILCSSSTHGLQNLRLSASIDTPFCWSLQPIWIQGKLQQRDIKDRYQRFPLTFTYLTYISFDNSLRSIGSRLYVAQGKPEEQLPILIEKWGIKLLTFEKDTEPYAILRDSKITASLSGNGVKVSSFCSHTLYESEHYVAASHGKVPTTYVAFCKLFLSMSKMRQPIGTITSSLVTNCITDAKLY